MKVSCGFNKWSIGFNKDLQAVTIEFCYFPNGGQISLYDVTNEELIALGQMFLTLGNTKIKE